MTQINSRPPFFPNSSSSGSSKTKNAAFSSDIAIGKTNSAERAEEINAVSGDHVRVDIPESIKDYAAIKKAVDNAPPQDNSAKIAALKQQIANGSYKIDDNAVASKMIENEF